MSANRFKDFRFSGIAQNWAYSTQLPLFLVDCYQRPLTEISVRAPLFVRLILGFI